MRRSLAFLNRHWQAGWSYAGIAIPIALGLAGWYIAAWISCGVLVAVNLVCAVPITKLLLERRAVKRARRARVGG